MSQGNNLNSTDGPVPHIPNEILEKILIFLPTRTLLRNCRFVAKTWKSLTTRLCLQRRSVSLRVSELLPSSPYSNSKILWLCRGMNDAPWSSCKINLRIHHVCPPIMNESPSIYSKYSFILEVVGSRLSELTLVVNEYKVVMANLWKVPNLEKLIISVEANSGPLVHPLPELENDPQFDSEFQLLKLKKLIIKTPKDCSMWDRNGRSSAFNCLQLILLKSPKLTNVTLGAEFISYDLEKLAPLLATIPSLALEFNYYCCSRDSLDLLRNSGCNKIIELEVWIRIDFYRPLERFLALNCEVLQKLTICFDTDVESYDAPFEIPPMRSLKMLHLQMLQELPRGPDESPTLFPFKSLVPFTTNHFPVLEDLSCGPYESTYDLFKDLNMESLKKLRLEPTSYDITTERDWASLCPKLEELEAHVNEPSLIYIMEKMTRLTKLCLSIHINLPSRTINSILSGIPNPGRAYKESRENVQKLRESSGYPSLLNLNKLKHLELYFPCRGTILCDSGVYLSLLQIQPLEYLSFNSTQISEKCKTALKKYHHHYSISYLKPRKCAHPVPF